MIAISNLWPLFVKYQNFSLLEEFDIKIENQNLDALKKESIEYFISWGVNCTGVKHSLLETGFFDFALHLDTCGLYDKCSLNLSGTRKIIENFSAPKTFKSLYQKISSKFGQPLFKKEWDGIVVACQYPKDRSVLNVGSTKDYYHFLENACKFYGKKVFLKKHPVMIQNSEENSFLDSLCSKYGCETGYVGESILEKAEAVLVYNSTYVVDAIRKKIPVMQFAPGYFWKTHVVDFTNRKLISNPNICDSLYIDKFLDFLIWKYCFSSKLSLEKVSKIIFAYKDSKDLFPLPEEFSYANYIDNA